MGFGDELRVLDNLRVGRHHAFDIRINLDNVRVQTLRREYRRLCRSLRVRKVVTSPSIETP